MTDPAREPVEPAKTKRRPIRHTLAAICLIVSCVVAPLAILSNFVKMELLNTDRYVSTVGPLVRNQAVTDYVATRVTDRLMSSVNVQELAEEALPARAAFLAGPIATGVRTFVEDAAKRVLASDQFAQIWDSANRTAHGQVRAALTDEGKNVKLENGKVVLDLSQLMIAVRTDLSDRGIGIFDKLPTVDNAIRVEIFDAKGLEQARQGVRALVIGRIVLVILTFGLAALGIFLARDRRRALAQWGFGIALSLGVVAGAITFGRGYALDHLSTNGIPRGAAEGVIDALLHYLRLALRAGIAVGLVVALAATLAGPGRAAARIRTLTRAAIDRSPAPDAGPFPRWVGTHRTLLRVAGVVLALLALITANAPGAITVLVATLVLLIWLGLIEIIGRSAIEVSMSPSASERATS